MKKRNLLGLFVPITRKDEETRIVEGYAFVNEVVKGEGGLRLRRSAMEAATPDYAKWGNIREMHQPSAVGTVRGEDLGISWDEKGCFFRAKIVDDDAWNKIVEGVYRGFSVGVVPTVMRGKEVEQCMWYETSVVDRPKDEDAEMAVVRSAGGDAVEVECEGEDLPEETDDDLERAAGEFKELMSNREPRILMSAAIDTLGGCLYDLNWDSSLAPAERIKRMKEIVGQFVSYATPLLERGELFQKVETESVLQFVEFDDKACSIKRSEAGALPCGVIISDADSEKLILVTGEHIDRIQKKIDEDGGAILRLTERVKELESKPVRVAPVRFTQGIDPVKIRAAIEGRPDANEEEITRLQAEIEELTSNPPAAEKERIAAVSRLQAVKARLHELGAPYQKED